MFLNDRVSLQISWTSFDVVRRVRSVLTEGYIKQLKSNQDRRLSLDAKTESKQRKTDIKVGHGGTLDPLAEGVLVLGIGSGTRLLNMYLRGEKAYRATGFLGFETDTLDKLGNRTLEVRSDHVTTAVLTDKLEQFRGKILQTPPMYSALKKNGEKLYDLARKGIIVDREPRPVEVFDLKLAQSAQGLPYFDLEVACGGGFYVRSLIHDLGRACNAAAHMTALTRTKQGVFELKDCLTEQEWTYDKLIAAVHQHSGKINIVSHP